jgi:ribonuclease BN (tRNA processing enzyme)
LKLTVVGSGTAAPEAGRVCSGYWVESAEGSLLLDCGAGVVHGMARLGLPWASLDHLLITHFHNDHIGDVPMLLFALKWGVQGGRTAPLTLWASHGIHGRLRAMRAAFGDHVADPGFPVLVREVEPGETFTAAGLSVRTTGTPHTEHSMAFRLEGGDSAVGYTGDTGPSEAVAALMKGVDVLVAECSLPDDLVGAGHLSPSSLAALVNRADPGQLVVTHVYPQLDALDPVARVREAGWAGEILRARDGLELEV